MIAEAINRLASARSHKELPLDSARLQSQVETWETVNAKVPDDQFTPLFNTLLAAHNFEQPFTANKVRDLFIERQTQASLDRAQQNMRNNRVECFYCNDVGTQVVWQLTARGWIKTARGCQCDKAGKALRKPHALGVLKLQKDGSQKLEGDGARWLKKKTVDEFVSVADVVTICADTKPAGFPGTRSLESAEWEPLPATQENIPFWGQCNEVKKLSQL